MDAESLRRGILSSLEDLRASRAAIDAANVYPVADSDTGTNLVMTLEAVAAALDRSAGTAAAAEAAQGSHEDVTQQFAAAARAAAEALSHTPEQMPALAAAGVVDAGGMGLVVVLEAFARALGADIGRPAPAAVPGDGTPPP